MASDAALYARLEVKLSTLEKQLKKAGAMAEGAVLDIEKKFAKANPKIGGAVAFGSFIGNLAGAGAQVAIRALQEMAQEMRALGETSTFTGLALKEVYAIQQAIGGKASDVNAALSSITTLLDRAQRGEKNALSEVLKVNGQDIKNVKDAGDAWSRVVDIISRAKTEVQAQEMGKLLGVSPEVVNNIRAVGSAYEDAKNQALAMAPDVEALAKLSAEFEESWTRAVKNIERLFLAGFASMKNVILEFLRDTATVLESIERFQAGVRSLTPAILGFHDKVGVPGQVAEEIRNKIARNWRPTDDEAPAGRGGAAAPPGGYSKPPAFDWNKRGRKPKTDDVERYLQQLQKQNDLLTAEAAAFGLSNVEKEKAVALAKLHAEAREAGRAPTEAEIANTLRLAGANESLSESIERTREAYAAVNTEAKAFTSTLVDGLIEGKDAAEALGDALNNLGKRLTDRAIDQLFNVLLPSTGGGLFSSLPKFATGGMVPGSGPVPIMAHGGEVVIPKASVKSLTSGQAGNTYAPVYQIDARGSEAGVEQKIVALIKAYDRETAERRMRFG